MTTMETEKNSIDVISLNELLPYELVALKQYYDMKWTEGCMSQRENHAMNMSRKIENRLNEITK